jgi:uncharacterized C2H2 Zn-finger protein
MSNPCKVIITRGKNKGKTCGSVNVKCKHVSEPLICPGCGLKFDRSTSYYRHINSCLVQKKTASKIRIAIKPKETTNDTANISNVYKRLIDLEEQNYALREEVEELKQKPMTNYNIAILGNDFYSELVDKIGNKRDAIEFLAKSYIESPLDVFQKLYLDDRKPEDYPVACRDKLHFRYLDNEKRMVDDQGGSSIGSVVSKQITNAMINAVNDCNGNGNTVYGLDDIETIRKKLETLDKDSMIENLAYITNNPNHPFFREE